MEKPTMGRMPLLPLTIVAAALLPGCDTDSIVAADSRPEAAAASEVEGEFLGAPHEVWLRGGVEAAFAAAASEGKPVLLYWGAEWCPYCADLEAHVFSRDDVRRKLALFVPVYLDGDEPGAQRWGDVFGVAGYPTVLVLAADRTELARIAGGMDLGLYAEALDLVLGDVRPVHDVLLAAETQALSPDDCRRLAYNGWGLEDMGADHAARRVAALTRAADACPAQLPVERARLIVAAASYAVSASETTIEEAELRRLVGEVGSLVSDRAVAVQIADALRSLGDDYFAAARRLEPDLAGELLSNWTQVMDAAYAEPRYGHGDRLAAVRSKIEAIAVLDPNGVSESLAADARRMIETTLGAVGDSPARRGAVNATLNLLVALEDLDAAYALAQRELATSRTPYYYMADLAWLDEKRGRSEDAIAWLERAYREATGPATRFQWGTSYVRGLIRLSPEDEASIRAAGLEVLAELDGPQRIYRRTRARLESLGASLREWNEDGRYGATIDALRQRMSAICEAIPDEPAALESCRSFLSTLAGTRA
jgi:protein disulfide-isomerase